MVPAPVLEKKQEMVKWIRSDNLLGSHPHRIYINKKRVLVREANRQVSLYLAISSGRADEEGC